MTEAFLIDSPVDPGWNASVKKRYTAWRPGRRFFVDNLTADFIMDQRPAFGEKAFQSMLQFAKPPFPLCVFEFDISERADEFLRAGCVVEGDCVFAYTNSAYSPYVHLNPLYAIRDQGRVTSLPGVDPKTYAKDEDMLVAALGDAFYLMSATILLLHQPKGVTVSAKPATSKIARGKRRAYAAHSTITIDVSYRDALRRVVANGHRGPVRAHEVRGHWQNWYKVAGCSHDWGSVPVEPDAPERYRCRQCGQLRVWRRHYHKGDAQIGYATHDYLVTKSG